MTTFPQTDLKLRNFKPFSQLLLSQANFEPLGSQAVTEGFQGCREWLPASTMSRNVAARCMYSTLCKTQQLYQLPLGVDSFQRGAWGFRSKSRLFTTAPDTTVGFCTA
jgi:hypothetical protein